MAITDRFPDWGETGSLPAAGFSYSGGDQVNEKHFDALWHNLDLFEDEVVSQAIVKDGSKAMAADLDMGINGITNIGGDLVDDDGDIIFDYSAQHVPLSILETAGSGSGLDADLLDGAHAEDLAASFNDGSVDARQTLALRFGAEGSTTSSTGYTTIAASDLAFDPDEYKDADGNLYVRMKAHLKHSANSGDVYCRIWRQNAATAVTGSEVVLTLNDGWGFADTGWIDFGAESGNESYQLQLKSGDGEQVSYNSVVLHFGTPV